MLPHSWNLQHQPYQRQIPENCRFSESIFYVCNIIVVETEISQVLLQVSIFHGKEIGLK